MGNCYKTSNHVHQSNEDPCSLASFLEEKKTTSISSETAKFILKQLCLGVQFLHENDIIHGDLIPLNIQINTDTNAVRIYNMSLPRSVANTTQVDLRGFSPEFDPPEKQTNKELTTKSDLYSLGAIGLALFGTKHGDNMKKPLGCTERLFDQLKGLTNKKESLRPPLSELLDILENNILNPQVKSEEILVSKEKQLNKNDTQMVDNTKTVSVQNSRDNDQNISSNSNNIEIQIPLKQLKQEQQQQLEDQEQLTNLQAVKRSSTIEKKEDKSISVQDKYEVIQNQIINEDKNQQEDTYQQMKLLRNRQNVEGKMKLTSRIECSSTKLSCLVYSDIHKVIISGGFDGIVSMYKMSKEGILTEVCKSNPADSTHGISQMLLSQDNNLLFVSLYSPSVLVYQLNKSSCKLIGQIKELLIHSLISFDIASNMKQILVTGANNQAYLYSLNQFTVSNKKIIGGFSGHAPICRFVNSKILLGLSTGKVLIYEENNLSTPIQELSMHSAAVTRIAISPNIISFSSLDGTISLMNSSFSLIQTLNPCKDSISSVAVTNDNQFIASSCWDGIIKLFQSDSAGCFKIIDQFSNQTSWVNDVVYLPSDKLLISIGGSYLQVFK